MPGEPGTKKDLRGGMKKPRLISISSRHDPYGLNSVLD